MRENSSTEGKTSTEDGPAPVNTKVDIKTLYKMGSVLVVDQSAPAASDTNEGTIEKPFKTINAAAQKAQPGMTVLVREGIYRERIVPKFSGEKDKPVVFQGVSREHVIVRGSEVWDSNWLQAPENPEVFSKNIPSELFAFFPNPFLRTISVGPDDSKAKARPSSEKELPLTLGQVFINGIPLDQLSDMDQISKKDSAWIVSEDGKKILLNLPAGIKRPQDCLIEVSVRNRIFAPQKRGLKYIHVKGFTFKHCANQGAFPQGGAVSVRSGSHWVIEDNIIRYAKMIGLDCGSETWNVKNLEDTDDKDKRLIIGGGHLIQNNIISDNGLCGIAGWNHKGTRILNNTLKRNNRLNIDGKIAKWEEWAAIKLHAADALIQGNIIYDNNAFGIWIDHGHKNARIVGNIIHNNQRAGIFFEYGAGDAYVYNNIISATRPYGKFYTGFGVYTHDAADIKVFNNLILNNSGPAVLMRTITNREFGGKKVYTSNQLIQSNILYRNCGFIHLPLNYKRAENNLSDYNLFVGESTGKGFGWPWSIDLDSKTSATLIKEQCSKSSDPSLSEDIRLMKEKKGVTAKLWKAVTGNDKNSIFNDRDMVINFDPVQLKITINTDLSSLLKSAAHEMYKKDFNDNGIVKEVFPGPFQDLKEGSNTYSLDKQ